MSVIFSFALFIEDFIFIYFCDYEIHYAYMMEVKAGMKRMYMISLLWVSERSQNFQMCITDILITVQYQNVSKLFKSRSKNFIQKIFKKNNLHLFFFINLN